MPRHVYLFSGASAVGKTSALKALLPLLEEGGTAPCVCKIDCLKTGDGALFQRMGLPCVTGLSGDICPDHFLVSNLPELWDWGGPIEAGHPGHRDCRTLPPLFPGHAAHDGRMCAGLHRQLPASGQLGPMLTQADFVVLTKIDMVSQAELEIISWQIRQINPGAALFPVDGLAGYGTDLLARWLLDRPACGSFEGDILRHTMPSGVCSYCVGEQRVGSAFQQGVVGKINFEEAEVCSL